MRLRQSRALPFLRGGAAPQPPASIHYYDRELKAQAIKILPGEYLATSRDVLLVTLLGSCVSACLHDPVAGVGGMNHFMLPERGDALSPIAASARYGVQAMEVLLNDMLKEGALRANLQAKVFGGGNVLKGMDTNPVGQQNAKFVIEFLRRERIPVLAEDLLGIRPRKVAYNPKTGNALVKQLASTHEPEVSSLESLYRDRLRQEPVYEGGIELFGP